ncbi:MAG: sirohydrochlorin chelatase [Puniceicoccaceae bacterium]
MKYLLVDNGSLRPESVLNLRRIARELGSVAGKEIFPSSLLHSSKIDPSELEGEPAVNMERRLRWFLESGEKDFTIIPFFFGPSGAIIDYLPKRLESLRNRFGDFNVKRTSFLYAGDEPASAANLTSILKDQVRATIQANQLIRPRVILVDHGSPLETVTQVRNQLADRLKLELAGEVDDLRPASMERREGDAYAFNEPLLETLLADKDWSCGPIVIAMLFLSPGRHAGPGGDVHQICLEANRMNTNFQPYMTDLVGSHPGIVHILHKRLQSSVFFL